MRSVKHLLACVALSVVCLALQSQTDTLVTLNGQKVPVIITEITAKDIIYKIPNKPDLPLFHFKRSNVTEIIFKDGSEINPMFNTINPYAKMEYPKARTILYFTPTRLFQNHIGFAYEHVFRKNIIGIRIPVSVAYNEVRKLAPEGVFMNENDNHRRFTAGVDLNIYPFRLGKFKYVTGIGIMYAQFAYLAILSYKPPHSEIRYGNHLSFLINNGFIAQATKHLVISASVGAGLQHENPDYYGTQLRINTTLNVGYLFCEPRISRIRACASKRLTDRIKCCKLEKPDFSFQINRVYEQHHSGYKCQNHSNGNLWSLYAPFAK